MPIVRRFRSRGVTMTIEAHAEIAVLPTGPIGAWSRRMTNDVKRFAAEAAPSNKRPRWDHYGEPLKKTIVASTHTDVVKGRVHTAIGSTAHYALFVDQGTSDFMAKILPPWTRGSPSLYEHTWKVPGAGADGGWHPVGRIRVRGQRAQFFMDKGVQRGLAAAGVRGVRTPLDGDLGAKSVGFPSTLANFVGATPSATPLLAGGAFLASLDEWRSWRDEAWNSHRKLGRGVNRADSRRARTPRMRKVRTPQQVQRSRERNLEASRKRSIRYRDRQRQKNKQKRKSNPNRASNAAARANDKARVRGIATKQYGNAIDSINYVNGQWEVVVKIGRNFETRYYPARS